ncbi:hypothetical protein BDP27DRAFT_1339866 [Rhodocollybia butyracea]|uniref:Uncharacterized protein n=1 Tax=Rhodocollybia butyracea TaxID=206335 RepID=A0A9P5P8M8_9AGAR|nr:hypothetical protein BDP27DRAFT_1346808 [Rhodocollybia butyracea]KAF9060306.1 hypothetical protein BDP27DRAFT_1339866 [Rhodocollybia butyracea]
MSNSGNHDLNSQEDVYEEHKKHPGMFDQEEWENDQDHRIMQEGTWESGYYSEDPHQQMSRNEGYGEYLEYIEMMEQNVHYQGPVFMEEEEGAMNNPSSPEHGNQRIDGFEGDCDQEFDTMEQGAEDSGGYYDEREQQAEMWEEEYGNYLEMMDTMEQEENYWENNF